MVNDTKATLSLATVSKALLDSLSVGWDTTQPPLTVVGVTVQQPLLLWLREALAHGEDVDVAAERDRWKADYEEKSIAYAAVYEELQNLKNQRTNKLLDNALTRIVQLEGMIVGAGLTVPPAETT